MGFASCSHLGRSGRAAPKHRPPSGGRPEDMEARFPAQASLASAAAGHHLTALGSLAAHAAPAGRRAVCGRGVAAWAVSSCRAALLTRFAACHRRHQAQRECLAIARARPAADGRNLGYAGATGTSSAYWHLIRPLRRTTPRAAALMTSYVQ